MFQAIGRYRIMAIDRRSGQMREWKAGNDLTDDGREFVAAALATQTTPFKPSTNSLQCRLLESDMDTTGAFTSTGGPMTAQVTVDSDGDVTSSPGFPIYHNPPTTGEPIRLRWYDSSRDTYAIHSVQVLNGTTVLSGADLTGEADKTEEEIIVVEYTLTFAASGAHAAGPAGLAVARRIAGQASTDFSASVTRDGALPASDMEQDVTITVAVDSEDAKQVVVTLTHQNTVGNNASRINGFTLDAGTDGVFDYDWSAGDTVIPYPRAGIVIWECRMAIGTPAEGTLSVSATPGRIHLVHPFTSADVTITASGGSGTWGALDITASDSRVSGAALAGRGSGPTWVVQITSNVNAMFDATVTIEVTRGEGQDALTGSIQIPFSKESV